ILKWMPEACYDPVRLGFHGWKKWLVGPIERWCLRRCAKIVATCEAEKEWIEKYLGKGCPAVEVTDIKRFFDVSRKERKERKDDSCVEERGLDSRVEHVERVEGGEGSRVENGEVHLLYLGRRHPLKGVEYLEIAVAELNSNPVNPVNPVQNYSARLTTSALSSSPRLCVRLVSNAFGDELERVWDWCDVLVLPTLSENFGLVVAEALERGKRVITTDGAPAWDHGIHRIHGNGMGEVGNHEIHETHEKGLWSGYGGRLIYLKGYRDGTDEERVELLKNAIERIGK
ncbi:MAG: glycosyltransferase, partial [Kiritimatiellae bacterium]|nr:glycosyltransferase [Kiritimatiellia bacterium]